MSEIDWKSLPALSSLRAFELTARTQSFAAAARALNVTHAAIAQRVRSLEADLGVHLVRRAGRTIALTEAGQRLSRHLTEGFETIAAGIAEVKADEHSKPVHVTTTVFFSQLMLLPRLEVFSRECPDIRVSVTPTQDIVDLTSQDVDFAIRASPTPPDWPGMRIEPLITSDLIIVGAPALLDGTIPPLQDLPWIWTEGSETEEAVLRAFGLHLETLRNADFGVTSYHISLVRRGLGVSMFPEVFVRDDVASGTLRQITPPTKISVTFYAVTPVGPVRPQAQIFLDWLKQNLGRDT